jgi:hypothetical protein
MKVACAFLVFVAFQAMTLQDKPVVHLRPHSDLIELAFGGSLLEIDHGPQVVHLPKFPPRPDADGDQWTIDVKNFGPAPVTIEGVFQFSVQVGVNQTIHIYSNGRAYLLRH